MSKIKTSCILKALTSFVILVALAQVSFAQTNKPKNVIVMIADGWGYNHIAMVEGYTNKKQIYDDFPVKLSMSTYNATGSYTSDSAWINYSYLSVNPTCSAAAATAMATGTKTTAGSIGVDQESNPLTNLCEVAYQQGKSAGVVTSVPLSHATPAGFSAHNKSRNNYSEIALNMLLDSKLNVIMGAGHPCYDNDGKKLDKAHDFKYVGGEETWKNLLAADTAFASKSIFGDNIVEDIDGDGRADWWQLIQSNNDFKNLKKAKITPKRVIGVAPVGGTLSQGRKGDSSIVALKEINKNIPTLALMTSAALNVLDANNKGFFLMIEGGAVDWASHANMPGRLIEEMALFNDAVKEVIRWVNKNSSWDETLLVITGDHECGYLTGPDYKQGSNLIETYPVIPTKKGKLPKHKFNSKHHSNQLIPFFAKGKNAKAFISFADENDVVRTKYLDNIEMAKVLKDMLQ